MLPLAGRVDSDLRFTSPIAPVTGFLTVDAAARAQLAGAFVDVVWHLVLPALTLAAYPIGLIARMTRASMLETLGRDYIRTARAYGIGERRIVSRLALRNALLPVLTVIGLVLAYSADGHVLRRGRVQLAGPGHVRGQVDPATWTTPRSWASPCSAPRSMSSSTSSSTSLQAWLDPRIRLA